jgi:hypothetical protein
MSAFRVKFFCCCTTTPIRNENWSYCSTNRWIAKKGEAKRLNAESFISSQAMFWKKNHGKYSISV